MTRGFPSCRRGLHDVIRLQSPSSSLGFHAAAQSSSTMMPSHEPTLIAAASSQTTTSSPRGTFSQAELTVSNSPRVREFADGCLPTRLGLYQDL